MSTQPFGHGMKSTDGKGHGDVRQIKLPPEMNYMGEQLVQSGEWPYRTIQDALRDGFARLLEDCHILKPESMPDYEQYKVAYELRVHLERRAFQEELISNVSKEFFFAKDPEEMAEIRQQCKRLLTTSLFADTREELQRLLTAHP